MVFHCCKFSSQRSRIVQASILLIFTVGGEEAGGFATKAMSVRGDSPSLPDIDGLRAEGGGDTASSRAGATLLETATTSLPRLANDRLRPNPAAPGDAGCT
mmetsp:Transcript_25287/g.44901  ORF Transcript_25287/g.44901 Transcript_25287/m.44901 type:complete len:101 (-) Transcript_25287:2530-2832(-)